MRELQHSLVFKAGLGILSLLLAATMAFAYGGGGGGGSEGTGGTKGGVEEADTQRDLSRSFSHATPSDEGTQVESFGGSTISKKGVAAVGQVFPEAGDADYDRHLDSMGKTLEVIEQHRHPSGLTVVKGVPLVTKDGSPVASVTGASGPRQLGKFTPKNGRNAFDRARNGSDPERNPEQAQMRAKAQKAVATAQSRLAEAGVQPSPAATPDEAVAAAARAVGVRNLAQMPRYNQSPTYAPATGAVAQ